MDSRFRLSRDPPIPAAPRARGTMLMVLARDDRAAHLAAEAEPPR